MSTRRSLSLPIALGTVMIVLLVILIVGWILLSVFGALADSRYAALYWVLLSVGTALMVLLLVGVVFYLVLSIKAINLTQRQSNFIDSVTHELKSPIASMKLYLQTLSRHRVGESQQADFYRYMLEDLERLDHLINQMLDAGRLEADRSDAKIEDVPLGPLLEECAEAACLSHHVPSETVRLDLKPYVVTARRVDLTMIFRNLIDNAVKYAGDPPEVAVTVHAADDEGQACVRISDNGPGIPIQFRRKVFGRFYRLGSELERKKPGTGLGLYIVRTLVRRLRGRVRVRGRDQQPGTTFEVELPARVE